MTKEEIKEEIKFAVSQKLVPSMEYFMKNFHSEEMDYFDIAVWFAEECTTSAYDLADDMAFSENEEE